MAAGSDATSLQRETGPLLRDLQNDVESSITGEAFLLIKQTLKDLRAVPGLDEAFLHEQEERLKGEVKRLAEQQNRARAWKRTLENVDQIAEVQAVMEHAKEKAPLDDDSSAAEGANGNVKAEAAAVEEAVEMPNMKAVLGGQLAAVRAQTDVALEQNPLWKEFLNRLDPNGGGGGGGGGGDDDEELEVMQTQQDDRFALKCPITLALLEDPVKNTACPHTYSRAGIMQSFKGNKQQVHCPVAGCGAMVTRHSLVEDKEKALAVKRHLRAEAAAAAAGGGGGRGRR